MHNLYLIQPVDKYGPNTFLPLAISYQWMYAQTDPVIRDSWQVADVLLHKEYVDRYVHEIDAEPSVMALSCYVWNWKYNITLAQKVKERYPHCKIIIGGPSVDKRVHTFFDEFPWIDVAITGEGEPAFQQVLLAHTRGEDISTFCDLEYGNVYSREARRDSIVLPERLNDLNIIPSPILEGFYDQIFEMYKHRVPADTKWQVTYETLRGCPYKCAFCDIGDSYWNKIKRFELDRVFAEIDWMSENQIEYVSVCDSNWGLIDRDKQITNYVIQKKQETGYPKFWDVTWAKANSQRIYEIAKMEKDSGTGLFKGVTFAMQSFNSDTLIATDRFNVDEQIANQYLLKYQEDDIATYSELIWPMPNETYESLAAGIQRLVDLGQKDFLMVHPLVLTPNAPMGQPEYRKQWQLETCTAPLDTFYLKVDNPDEYVVEYTEAVRSTNSADFQEVIQGFMFSYMFITMFYYGWGYVIMEYMNLKYHVRHRELIEKMLEYFSDKPSLIKQEMNETKQAFVGVFDNQGFWGRKGLCPDDIYWEYKSGTSVVFDQHREQLFSELADFLRDCYEITDTELLSWNKDLCYDFRKSYPVTKTVTDHYLKQILGVSDDQVILDHWETEELTESDFHKVAYHYQRKNRYWKCLVRNTIEKPKEPAQDDLGTCLQVLQVNSTD